MTDTARIAAIRERAIENVAERIGQVVLDSLTDIGRVNIAQNYPEAVYFAERELILLGSLDKAHELLRTERQWHRESYRRRCDIYPTDVMSDTRCEFCAAVDELLGGVK